MKRTLPAPDDSSLPSTLRPVPAAKTEPVVRERLLTLEESTDVYGRLLLLLNGLRFTDPITERVRLDTAETWSMINLTPDTHPIHLHLVRFRILSRQPFDVDRYLADNVLVFTGPPVAPGPDEAGWKDTVRTPPGMVTRIVSRFEDFTGEYVWHCHILEHECNEMMRPYEVFAGDGGDGTPTDNTAADGDPPVITMKEISGGAGAAGGMGCSVVGRSRPGRENDPAFIGLLAAVAVALALRGRLGRRRRAGRR